MSDTESFEQTVRRAFARLTGEALPAAADARGWPVRTREDFERLLLGHLDAQTSPPCVVDLVLAVELGEGLLTGQLCCRTMERRLRCEADKGDPRRAAAFKALIDAVSRRN